MKSHITTLLYIVLLAHTAQNMSMDGYLTTNNGVPLAPIEYIMHEAQPTKPFTWATPLDPAEAQISYDHAPATIQNTIDTMRNFREKNKTIEHRNYLFHGDYGIGKTMLAQAMAQAASTSDTTWHCALLRVSKYTEKYQSSASGHIVKKMKSIRAQNQPCVIVLDELTHITKNYGQEHNFNNDAATTVAAEMDTCNERNDIIIVGTTNNKSDIPEILNSRFGELGIIEIPMPSFDLRMDLINHLFQKEIQNQTLTDSHIKMIAKKTEGKGLRKIALDLYKKVVNEAQTRRRLEKKLAKQLGKSDEEIAALDQDGGYTITQADIDAVMATGPSWYQQIYETYCPSRRDIIKTLPITLPITIGIVGLGVTIWQLKKNQDNTNKQMKFSLEQAQKAAEQSAAQLKIATEQLNMQKQAKAEEWHWGWKAAGEVLRFAAYTTVQVILQKNQNDNTNK